MCFNKENRSVVLVGTEAKASASRQSKNIFMEKQISNIQFRERQWKLKKVKTTHLNPFPFPMRVFPGHFSPRKWPYFGSVLQLRQSLACFSPI